MGELIQLPSRLVRPGQPLPQVIYIGPRDVDRITRDVQRFGLPELHDQIAADLLGVLPTLGRGGAT